MFCNIGLVISIKVGQIFVSSTPIMIPSQLGVLSLVRSSCSHMHCLFRSFRQHGAWSLVYYSILSFKAFSEQANLQESQCVMFVKNLWIQRLNHLLVITNIPTRQTQCKRNINQLLWVTTFAFQAWETSVQSLVGPPLKVLRIIKDGKCYLNTDISKQLNFLLGTPLTNE